jgi:predicted nucleic acid-binding protein
LLQGVKNINEKEVIQNYWKHLPKENHENIIIEAGLYSSENKLLDYGVGLIDAIILMHGIKNNSKIWTLDNKFLRIIPEELKYIENPNVV